MIVKLISAAAVALLAAAPAGSAWAQESIADGAHASSEAARAVGDLGASGVHTAVGVAAVPISGAAVGSVVGGSVVAAAGGASVGAGAQASTAAGGASAFANTPLPLSPDVVVAPQARLHVPYAAQPPAKPQ